MTVSVWNTTPGWHELNKSKSFMTVIIKANPIQIELFLGTRDMKLWKRV